VTDVAERFALGDVLIGYAVLDVVEGSAMDALKSMQAYLASRPRQFRSLEEAVQWHIRSRTLRNIESAWASVPSLLRKDGERWVWRTELERTETYWEDWFGGMSRKFLSGRGAKLLILAGTDRLDKELMIGQMQGKLALYLFFYYTQQLMRRQASFNFKSSQMLGTSCRKMSPSVRRRSSLHSSSEMTAALWCCLPRSRISLLRAKRFECK
jgi:hypothetical protein